jgi:nitrite reductase (NADH) small subunit
VRWHDIGGADEIAKRKRLVVSDGEDSIVVVAHEGCVYAMDNICIHRERELVKGVVLKGKLVCPGHQWAFALDSGWEAVKEECQPTYDVRVTDAGRVELDLDSKARRAAPTTDPVPTADPAPAES